MNAVEIIERIKAMTPTEQAEVLAFIRQLRAASAAAPEASPPPAGVTAANDKPAKPPAGAGRGPVQSV